jgi:hypothetical protein
MSERASLMLEEIRSAASARHVELALALQLNVMNDPGDPRSVEAVKALEAWLREGLSPAVQKLQDEFRAMVGKGEDRTPRAGLRPDRLLRRLAGHGSPDAGAVSKYVFAFGAPIRYSGGDQNL